MFINWISNFQMQRDSYAAKRGIPYPFTKIGSQTIAETASQVTEMWSVRQTRYAYEQAARELAQGQRIGPFHSTV
jgi:hypothetical protein